MRLGFALLLGAAAFGQERTERVYDVRVLDIAQHRPTQPSVWFGTQLQLDALEPDGPHPFELDPWWFDGEDWLLTLDATLDPLDDRHDLTGEDGHLFVTTTDAGHARVREVLADFERLATASVELQAFRLPPGDLDPGALTASEVASLLQSTPATTALWGRAPYGYPTTLGSPSRRAVVYDYDCEVGGFTGVSDPQVSWALDGWQLTAVVQPELDGRWLLRVWTEERREVLPPRSLEPDLREHAPVHLPAWEVMQAFGTACLEPGGGFLIGDDHMGGDLVLIRLVGGPSIGGPGDVFAPVASLLAHHLDSSPPRHYGMAPSGGVFPPDMPDLSRDRLHDSRELLEELGIDERAGLGFVLHQHGGVSEEVRDGIRRLQASELETIAFDVRAGRVSRESAVAIAGGLVDIEQLVTTLPRRLTAAARPGDTCLAVGGVRRAHLQDYDLEIAQIADADPVIGLPFAGTSCWFRPTRLGDGRVQSMARFEWIEWLGEFEPWPIAWGTEDTLAGAERQRSTGTIELPTAARADVLQPIVLTPGEWHLLCCAPLGRTDDACVAVVRVTVD